MASFLALDANEIPLNFDAEGDGSVGNPHRNRSVIAKIDAPTEFSAFTGTILTGSNAELLPNLPGQVFRFVNLSTGFIYLVGLADSSVGADLSVVANRFTIRPRRETVFEIANTNQILVGSSLNGAQYTLQTTRFP